MTATVVPGNTIDEAGMYLQWSQQTQSKQNQKPRPEKLTSQMQEETENTGQAALLSKSGRFWKQQRDNRTEAWLFLLKGDSCYRVVKEGGTSRQQGVTRLTPLTAPRESGSTWPLLRWWNYSIVGVTEAAPAQHPKKVSTPIDSNGSQHCSESNTYLLNEPYHMSSSEFCCFFKWWRSWQWWGQ